MACIRRYENHHYQLRSLLRNTNFVNLQSHLIHISSIHTTLSLLLLPMQHYLTFTKRTRNSARLIDQLGIAMHCSPYTSVICCVTSHFAVSHIGKEPKCLMHTGLWVRVIGYNGKRRNGPSVACKANMCCDL